MKTRVLAFAVLGCFSLGLSQGSGEEKSPAVVVDEESPVAGVDEESPTVGVVSTITHEYTLHAGPEGTLYTVRDMSGQEIARLVSFTELAASHPKLSEELKSLYAGNQRMNLPASHEIDPLATIRWDQDETPLAPKIRIIPSDLPDFKSARE